LLDRGADIHADNDRALVLAKKYNHIKIVDLLENYVSKKDTAKISKKALPKKTIKKIVCKSVVEKVEVKPVAKKHVSFLETLLNI